MNPTSRPATKNVGRDSWRTSRSRHTLLLQMAKEAEELAAQAQRLTELKKQARGVTFAKIAAHVGVTERQVQRWFAGDSDIDASRLKKLARYLGTTEDYIEYGTIRRPKRGTPDLTASLNGQGRSFDERLTAIEEELQRLTGAVSELVAGMADLASRAAGQSRGSRTAGNRH